MWYNDKKEEYNKEPVTFCKVCLSLNVRYVEGHEGQCYCEDCGCTEFNEASIEEHDRLYYEKYGKHLINNKDGRG